MTIPAKQTFQTILALPVSKLQSASVLSDSTRIFASLMSDEEISRHLPDDKFIVVRPQSFPPHVGRQSGGGRNTLEIDGTLTVSLWLRLWIDQASRSDKWITDSTLGAAALMTTITSALEQYHPTDSNGAYYFVHPMRLLPPGWTFPAQRVGEWGKVESTWSIVFWLSLS